MGFTLVVIGVVFSSAFEVEAADAEGAKVPRGRRAFAQAISKLKEGMTAKDALRVLGAPDDIRTRHDPGGISTTRTKEIWRYGTAGHLTTATLGQVYIDQDDQVQYLFGTGKPLADDLFEEADLREMLRVLDAVPSYSSGHEYDPLKVIRAVNLLQPLGKDKAIAAMSEYLRVSPGWHDGGREGVFLVLRTLFEVPKIDGFMPGMYVGAPSPANHEDKTLLPRFPIALMDDIPFLVVRGYSLDGLPESPEAHLEKFRKEGMIRGSLLKPTVRPVDALEKLAASPAWPFTDKESLDSDERGRWLLGNQVLRMLDSVYRVESGIYGELLPFGKKGQAMLKEASHLDLRWDSAENRYTRPDGTTLAHVPAPLYRREIWKPDRSESDAEIIMERQGRRFVQVSLEEKLDGQPHPGAAFRVTLLPGRDVLYRFAAGDEYPNGGSGFRSSSTTLKIPEGSEIQIEFEEGTHKERSPVFKP